jgi:hypothetical protein
MVVCQIAHLQMTHRYRGRRASGGSYGSENLQASCEQIPQRAVVMRTNPVTYGAMRTKRQAKKIPAAIAARILFFAVASNLPFEARG